MLVPRFIEEEACTEQAHASMLSPKGRVITLAILSSNCSYAVMLPELKMLPHTPRAPLGARACVQCVRTNVNVAPGRVIGSEDI